MSELPVHIQAALWEECVRQAEAAYLPLRLNRLDIPTERVMMMTTLTARWSYESTLDIITPLPPTAWGAADTDTEIQLLEMVFASWLDPRIKQAFDSLIDTMEPVLAYERASSYRAALQASFPEVREREETIAFLVEVDRRFFQLVKSKEMVDPQRLYDRLRNVIGQFQQEATEAKQEAEVVFDQIFPKPKGSKGFG
jgi:hypothetical protein